MGTKSKKKQSVIVDEQKLTDIVKKLVNTPPIKREDVKGSSPKPGKIIPERS